jgi:hypothetical protein
LINATKCGILNPGGSLLGGLMPKKKINISLTEEQARYLHDFLGTPVSGQLALDAMRVHLSAVDSLRGQVIAQIEVEEKIDNSKSKK